MILDEAQAIKSSSSTRWKSLLNFHCRNRLLLTGTPVQNSMQELWALLHFIMPTLFDSHEEFSEWFSKDIESHAQSNTSLNEQQLKRLHMILKPFMLRRVKKNVQSELGEKIELDVFCNLSYRQRAYYRTLKEKISIGDLIDRAASGEDMDSLMNLVMQFRKVCNHPDLFERADVKSPLFCGTFAETGSIMRETHLNLAYTSQNHIRLNLPKFLYRHGGLLDVPSDYTDAGFKRRYLDNIFNIWTTESISSSIHTQSPMSLLPLIHQTPADARLSWKMDKSQLRAASEADILQWRRFDTYADDFQPFTIRVARNFSNVSLRQSTDEGILSELCSVGRDYYLDNYMHIMEPAYMAKASANPVAVDCADRSWTNEAQRRRYNSDWHDLIFGTPEFILEKALRQDRSINLSDAQDHLPSPVLRKAGFSSISIPAMGRFVSDSGKLLALDKLLAELKAGGHRVLLYFQMTKMIDLMEEYLSFRQYKYLRLDGSSKISERRDMVSDWQTRSDLFIFVLSTRAGGLGINLTAADTVIFYDSDWNPTIDSQAMDRAHRLGQTKQVTVYRLITRNTIEERILKRAKEKEEVQKVVISGGDYKQSVDFNNRPGDVVSWLLDDDEMEATLKRQQVKRAAEEAKANKKQLPKKRKLGAAVLDGVVPNRTLDDLYHEGISALHRSSQLISSR